MLINIDMIEFTIFKSNHCCLKKLPKTSTPAISIDITVLFAYLPKNNKSDIKITCAIKPYS